jgi:hypothetical protein
MQRILSVGAMILSIISTTAISSIATPKQQPTPTRSQGIVAPTGNSLVAEFGCRSRGSNTGSITFTADRQYKLLSGNGRYSTFTNSFGIGYRFLTGPEKNRSIVRQKGGIFLVGTPQEKQAAELAARDAALICTGGEINY